MIMPVEITTKKSNRQEQELYLLNAHVALETGQPEKAQFYLNKLQSTRLPRKRQARYYFLKGKTAVLLQHYETARADLERALALFESSEGSEPLDIERTRAWLGTIYYQEGHYREALEFYERCLETLKHGTIDDPNFHVLVYHNLASGYHLIGDNEKALACYRAAVELSEGLEANSELAALYWGMGLVYRSQNNLPMAKLYLDKSAGLYETLGYLKEAATVRGMVGLAMIQRKELEEAQKALSSALQIARRLQDAGALYSASINLAELHYVQSNFIQAEKYAGEALEQARTLADNFRLGQALAQLADAKLARSITEEGLALYEQSIKYLEETDAVAYLAEVCFRFGNALESLSQYRRAFEMYRKAYLLKPSTSRPLLVTID